MKALCQVCWKSNTECTLYEGSTVCTRCLKKKVEASISQIPTCECHYCVYHHPGIHSPAEMKDPPIVPGETVEG